MCGIFALLNSHIFNNTLPNNDIINNEFMKGQRRGPEFSKLETKYIKMRLGFHRLAINGLNEESNQPLVINDVVLICNGEIYNYKQLYKYMNVEPETGSDCEVIIHLYLKYGIEQTLIMLDGVFSFVLYDNRIQDDITNNVYVARDPFGVRPLYYLKHNYTKNYNMYGFASELKCLENFYNLNIQQYSIEQFTPGTYSVFSLSNVVNSSWEPFKENIAYFTPTFPYSRPSFNNIVMLFDEFYAGVSQYLICAVNKRCLATERPIACLLSGGLDSSLIAALVADFYRINLNGKILETYSIGLENSEDLKYARIVSKWINSYHTEITVTEDDMFNAIPEVIMAIESYDTTTVRASIGNYLLGKYIAKHSQAKVIFNGDGSDELFGGYLYMNKCPDDIEFDKETRRLLKDIHLFDVLRSDKSISSNGLEPRTPFLDRNFANYVLSIPPYFRNHNNLNHIEKYLLRESFVDYTDSRGYNILPDAILFRKKEAFSDGVSTKGRSLYTILQEKIANKLNENSSRMFSTSIDTEKYYYRKIFNEYFPNCENIIPYLWMPKYTNTNDPSARTLYFYDDENSRASIENLENVEINELIDLEFSEG
jgi:asparagine synthase (glutamine-hydrolysing)